MPKAAKIRNPEPELPDSSFSSQEVSKLTGVSLRQSQWWDEQGVVTPLQRGHRRLYQMSEVVEIGLITELRRKGISLQKIRRVLRYLQKNANKSLYDTISNGSEVHLLTDGKHIYLEDDHRNIIDILKNARQPIISVCVSDQFKRLTSAIAVKKPPTTEKESVPAARATRAS
jgi:DNA-binding transcriptional MerR regulator